VLVTLTEAKAWLRLEPEYTAEDGIIQTLADAAELYLKNATGVQYDETNPLARLLVQVLVADWYENREAIGRATDKTRFTVDSILAQLSYCAPPATGGVV
jgi:uncharacterized phage protein (predicted DNA packaging)